MSSEQTLWWQSGVVYQIYPRSFMDSNGDGIGDLTGVTEKLDYLNWLGIDAIWLSPFYPSPLADFGYDVSDYVNVHPHYGDLAAFDQLVKEANNRDIKIIIDLVPNHTSDEHVWFQESRSSKTNPKRDWYVWRDPQPNGDPPNNWLSYFGGRAWEMDQETGQYYLHLFHKKQPDLNWRNPEVKQAMYDVMNFWLKRGVHGFRIDVIPALIKDEHLRDNPLNPDWKEGDPYSLQHFSHYSEDQPEIHDITKEMRQITDQYPERVLIGETYMPNPRLVKYYGENLDGLHLPFNFGLLSFSELAAEKVKHMVDEYEAALPEGAWPNWVLGNHDTKRIASRIGVARAKIAQMLLLTLRGTPTCYYGDELGMTNITLSTELTRDPAAVGSPEHGRDPARTPMQWNSQPNAGFSPPNVTTWLPVAPNYQQQNVEVEQQDPATLLNLVHTLIELRRTKAALNRGSYRSLDNVPTDCYVYLREFEGQKFLIALNFSAQEQQLILPELEKGHLLLSTEAKPTGTVDLAKLTLAGAEGVIIELG